MQTYKNKFIWRKFQLAIPTSEGKLVAQPVSRISPISRPGQELAAMRALISWKPPSLRSFSEDFIRRRGAILRHTRGASRRASNLARVATRAHPKIDRVNATLAKLPALLSIPGERRTTLINRSLFRGMSNPCAIGPTSYSLLSIVRLTVASR